MCSHIFGAYEKRLSDSKYAVLSRFLCNTESLCKSYGLSTKLKMSSIISGDIPFFDLCVSVAGPWRYIWCKITELFFTNNTLNERSCKFEILGISMY